MLLLNRHFRLALALVFVAILTGSTAIAQLTTPEDFLGYKPGADFKLQTFEEAIGYYELLASQTDRMQIFDMGPTSDGRRMKYAVVSSEANIADLQRYKEINRKLSLVRGVTEDDAQKMAEDGKAVVWIDGGLHGTEVAPAQLMVQLAYDLVSREDEHARAIRDNVITLLVYANPDGMTIVSDWYMKNVGTPYELSPIPWLYHKYVGHDNNRDSFTSNLVETQNMNRATSTEWFPHILYNQHQRGPFPARIWIPPDAEPTNPNVHPLIVRWKNLIGSAMGKAFEEENKQGAISRIRYDTWYPGYCTQVVDGHNTASILTETQLYAYATPHFYTLYDFPEAHRDLTVGTFYPNPWQGGWWRIGDAVEYNRTACFAVLDVAAKYRKDLLLGKYDAGKDVIEKFSTEPPYGWIFPADQRDPNTTNLLMERMMFNGIEVYRADQPFTMDGISYEPGSFIIPASQPFGYFAKNILEKQDYPDLRKYVHLWQSLVNTVRWDGSPLRPYDGVGWTLPAQMGVEFREMSKTLDIPMTQLESAAARSGSVSGGGSHMIFSHADNNSFKAVAQLQNEGGRVRWANSGFSAGGSDWPAGTFFVDKNSVSGSALNRIAAETGTDFIGGSVRVQSTLLKKPNIALYKSWVASMDMGWIMFILDQFGYDYHLLSDAEIRAGNLKNRFDVIVLPDQGASQMINGHRKGTIHPDYIGGMTMEGVSNLKEFVESGGIMVCNKASSGLALDHFDLDVTNILQGVSPDSFNCPGSILRMEYKTDSPLAFGMQQHDIAYFSRGLVFEIKKEEAEEEEHKETGEHDEKGEHEEDSHDNIRIIAQYPESNLLYSGWMLGEEKIAGKPSALDVTYGSGRLILYGFNIHNRAQAHTTFRLLFNSFFYQ